MRHDRFEKKNRSHVVNQQFKAYTCIMWHVVIKWKKPKIYYTDETVPHPIEEKTSHITGRRVLSRNNNLFFKVCVCLFVEENISAAMFH